VGDIRELGNIVAGAPAHPDQGGNGEYLPLVGDFMSFNEIVDTLNRQGHTFSVRQVPKTVFAAFFPGAAEAAETFSYLQAHTCLGSDWSHRIVLANKIAGRQPTKFSTPKCNHSLLTSANERGELLLDHVIITVKDLDRSIVFYDTPLKPLGIVHALDYDGKNGPEGHPDFKGFGRDGRVFFWLSQGDARRQGCAYRLCRQERGRGERVLQAAMAAGATDNGKPAARACITIPVFTLRTFLITTATVSRRSTRAGKTAKHSASKFQNAFPAGPRTVPMQELREDMQ
jgi:hypothetical protein